RRYLVGEIGIEPGPALRGLEQAVLEQDPALGAPQALPPLPRPDALARLLRHPGRLSTAGAALVLATVVGAVLSGTGDGCKASLGATAGDAVVAVDPRSGQVVAEIPVGGTPTSIAVGAGAVWALNADDQTIARIDPKSKRVSTFGVGATPTNLAADAHPPCVGVGAAL